MRLGIFSAQNYQKSMPVRVIFQEFLAILCCGNLQRVPEKHQTKKTTVCGKIIFKMAMGIHYNAIDKEI
jgi:hypothetical protein